MQMPIKVGWRDNFLALLDFSRSIASTSQQRQSIFLAMFLQCPHMHQARFSILILYVIKRELKRKYVQFLSMVENGGAKDFIVTCILLRIITFFIKI